MPFYSVTIQKAKSGAGRLKKKEIARPKIFQGPWRALNPSYQGVDRGIFITGRA